MASPLSNIKQFIARPIPFLHQQFLQQGNLASVSMGHKKFFIVTEPNLVKTILTDENYQKCRMVFDKIRPITGKHGIVQLEGQAWEKIHAITQPNFYRLALESYLPFFEKNIEYLKTTKLNDQIDCFDVMTHYALGSIMNITLGPNNISNTENITNHFIALNQQCGKKLRSIFDFPLWLPTPTNNLIKKHRKRLLDAVKKQCALMDGQIPCPFYSSLTRLNSNHLILDQITTFLFAGFETTAASLAFTFYLLSKHQTVQAKVYQEVQQVLHSTSAITLPALKSLTYTQAVYQESLRLYPPAWILAREVKETTVLDKQIIKPGNIVLINIRDLHRHPDFWPKPNKFYPERFINNSTAHKYAYIPFGMGKRICSGYQLAMIEAIYVISKLVLDFQFELKEYGRLRTQAMVTQHPKDTIKLLIRKR
ncbi:putative unspecific monooxygenase [Legionella beliardensis]|uniref:Putative unspecific monooxygenase n=1 Tax=Legionella beliardensis TaxID=91822 RepID=A0A378I3V4_9GAMM|nr:cytochrome P450 [Legionella beliardensis]STX29395.1 putative unspecific monooxygenase [Legionella beliardensis]